MPSIIDREVVGDKAHERFVYPSVPLGIMTEQYMKRNMEEHGDGPAMTDARTGKTVTYSELYANIRAVASALRKRGLKSGECVVAIGNNYIDYAIFCLAVWRAGGVLGTLIPTLHPGDYQTRLTDMNSKFVLADHESLAKVLEISSKLSFLQEVFSLEECSTGGVTPFSELLQDAGDECPENLDEVPTSSTVWVAFTSGTTGRAKPIDHTHKTVGGFMVDNCSPVKIAGRKILFTNPFNNGAGLVVVVTAILDHLSMVLMATYTEEELLQYIHRYQPQAISIFPAHIAFICRHPQLEEYDLSSVLSLSTIGSLVHPKYEREIFEKLPRLMYQRIAYGMTEIGIVTSQSPTLKELVETKTKEKAIARHVFGSAGRPHQYVKLKILDEKSGEKLAAGEVGEVYASCPFRCVKYLNNPKATEELMAGDWARTGDKGYYDEHGNLFIVGRFKELIKYRNINIVPTDIEEHMMTHPAIDDVGVIGKPNEVDGERPIAFVKLRSGFNVTAEELIKFTNEQVTLDAEKLRGGIRFVDHIPRNTLGKIIRPELAKWL